MKNSSIIQFLSFFLCVLFFISCQDNKPIAWWKFDKIQKTVTHESVGGIEDTVRGQFKHTSGVLNQALEFDGYTAHVIRKAQYVPEISKMFTIQVWLAPQVYSWNEAAIIDWDQDQKKGFTFGVNCYGRVYFYVSVEGEWKKLVTRNTIPLWKWSHLTATFDSSNGLNIFINGENEGSLKSKGKMSVPQDQDLWLGKNHTKKFPWGTERSLSRELSYTEMYWQGLIDEVKIFNQVLSADNIKNPLTMI
jgi:hypothetical protein